MICFRNISVLDLQRYASHYVSYIQERLRNYLLVVIHLNKLRLENLILWDNKSLLSHIEYGMKYLKWIPTCYCEVKYTFFVVPTRRLCLRSLCGRHVVEDVLEKERFELIVRESRVSLA